MRYQSRPVDSDQTGIHKLLHKILQTHFSSDYRKPISSYSCELFASLQKRRERYAMPLILDSGCGTGASTRRLAQDNPECLVIGVDKSSHRLALGGLQENIVEENNAILLKMNLVDFWRLAVTHNWQLQKHYLLYPNPWPKSKLIRRRWHAHPVFPFLLRLGGELELRCNWLIYAEEFKFAIDWLGLGMLELEEYIAETPISLFEKKYTASGHKLYRCHGSLDRLAIISQNCGESQPLVLATGSG